MNMDSLGTGLFIPVDKGIETIFRYSCDSQQVQNHIWFQAAGIPTVDDLEEANGLAAFLWGYLYTELSASFYIREIQSYDRTARVRPSRVRTDFANENGSVTGDFAPMNVSCCVSLKTGYGHRSARGRFYICGIPDGKVSGNGFVQAWRDALSVAFNTFLGAVQASNLTWVVASRYHEGEPRPLGVCTPITGVGIDNIVDSQRRRLPGRGR